MASCLQKIPSGNESRARKEKMVKWIFQTIAKDRNWNTKQNEITSENKMKILFWLCPAKAKIDSHTKIITLFI